MPAVVGAGVDVDLDDLDLGVVEMVGHPLRIDEDLRVCVAGLRDLRGGLGHLFLLKLTNWIHKLNNSGPQIYGRQEGTVKPRTALAGLDRRKAWGEALFDPVEM